MTEHSNGELVLVPREPTRAMLDAVWAADLDIYWNYCSNEKPGGPADVYRAMLAAAPTPPSTDRIAAEQRGAASSQQAVTWTPPEACDGKEQYAFEEYASSRHYDMTEHPFHYIFLDPKTNAARLAWNAALKYVRDLHVASASPSPASDSTRVIDMAVAWRNARLAVASLSVSDPAYLEKFNTLANAEDALNSAIQEIYEMVVADQKGDGHE